MCDMNYFTSDANKIITIIFVKSPEDMDIKKERCKPKMTHQIFQKESIFGYNGLKVKLFYSCYTYHCYVEISYLDKWDDTYWGLKADNIIDCLSPWLREAMILNKADFINILKNYERSLKYGVSLEEFDHLVLPDRNILGSIRICDIKDKEFVKLHQRFESLIIMYIDAANFIDMTDNNWKVIYLYEKKFVKPNVIRYTPIGFATIYIFDTKKIGRISQFFITPLYQGQGLGFIFLRTISQYLRSNALDIKKISVESPNKLFTYLRDKVDVSNCLDLPVFTINEIRGGLASDAYKRICSNFKLCKKQAKRIYEILRAYYCDLGIDDYEEFKSNFIKDRKIEILDLRIYPKRERDYQLKLFESNIAIQNANLNKVFENFMRSIQHILLYLKTRI
ncbi:histone acetyltransferase type B catalytic subunit [Onthophagus taurus]|uniref:histone acetyltransferase type B catalytic subunit n=1 Tax=Onthophagus taurus TaxID=166361 RepID=UPI000C1FD8FD|nr:histone acetyltransferase type B catalytic subunit [Onthophagus taurus]